MGLIKTHTMIESLFVGVDALHPSQQFFSYVGTIYCLPE